MADELFYYLESILSATKDNDSWRSNTVNLIASENAISPLVKSIYSSDFSHRYAEGHPGKRYYQGTKYIDKIESIVEDLFRDIFNCKEVDVRPISGTVANDSLFSRLIPYKDNVMVNSTPGGGHISHHSAGSVGKFAKSNIIDFPLTQDGYHIDVEKTKELISHYKPKLLVFGKSMFLFPDPVAELSPICKEKKIPIIYDGAHVLGLIAGGKFQDPLNEGADYLSGSTHKTFFGPQRGAIMSNVDKDVWKKIESSVFPGSTSNHHLATLAALGIASLEVKKYGKDYASSVVSNAKALASSLDKYGFDVQGKEFGFTESHQVVVDLSSLGGGKKSAESLEENNIIVNYNLLPYEPRNKVMNPAGIRIGVQEMTRFGMRPEDMDVLASFMNSILNKNENIAEEVSKWRSSFSDMEYCFDKDNYNS